MPTITKNQAGVVPPNSSTDKAIVAFNGTTGGVVQNTPATVDPATGNINTPGSATATSFVGPLTGNASTATSATTAGSATNFSGALGGDVTGTQGATVVSTVGGSSAANVNTATALIVGNKTANTLLAGPTTGAAAAATFRALVNADLPAKLLGSDIYTVGANQFYTTIQSALTAFGNAAATADVKKAGTFLIEGGNYDEALTIPQGRIINIIPLGTVVLGDGAGANWASTTPRSVTFTANVADVFASDIKPALNIFPIAGCDTTSTFIMESGCFRISGNLNIAGDGLSHTINLSSTRIDGTVTKTAAGLTNLQAYRTYFVGAINAGTSTVLERAYDCQFDSLVTIDSCNMLANCEIKAGMTVNAAVNNLPPSGWFFTTFTGTFTGPAASLKLDPVSDYFFITNGATLAGGATKVLISSIPALNTKYPPTTSADWSVVPTTAQGALDTLATSGVVKAQAANLVLAGPASGAAAVPTLRALVAADINTIASTKLTTDTTANSNVSPGPTALTSYTVPASTLAINGNALRALAFGQCAANGNAKQIIMVLGSTTIFDSGSIVLNGDDWMIEAEIIRTGASAEKAIVKFHTASNLMGPIVKYTSLAEDLTTGLALKCTGTANSNADITQQGLKVILEP